MNPMSYLIAAFALGALVHLALRFWGGNLRRGAGDRDPLGVSAFLGFLLGAGYLAAYSMKLGVSHIYYRWEHATLVDVSDYLEWGSLWMDEYVRYMHEVFWKVSRAFEWQTFGSGIVEVAVLAFLALTVVSALWHRSRGKQSPGALQDFTVGFLGSIGLAPFAAVAFGVGWVFVILGCLLFLGIVKRFFGRRPIGS